MTYNEFKSLQPGDKVRLYFSSEEWQYVVYCDYTNNTISTTPDENNTTKVTYVNSFKDIDYGEKPLIPKQSEQKNHILSMFNKFAKEGCDKCPFKVECNLTYDSIRMITTNAFGICTALTMKKLRYN